MKRIFLLTVILISSFYCAAQRFTAFSPDPSQTIEDMKEFSATVPKEKQKEAALLVEEFTAFWNSPEMDYEFQENFIKVANQMLKKHLRFFPHFKSYIHAYQAFLNSDLTDNNKEWDKIIKYHIINDGNTFHNKMDNYTALFTANMLVTSTNSRWRSENPADALGFDKEPFIEFKKTDLTGCSKQDSLIIYGTSGRYFPSSLRWEGQGGEVYWDRAGIGNDVKAVIADYNIDLRQPRFTAENALLHYPALFGYPLKGRLEDKAGLLTTEEKATYPRFKSYDNNIVIKDIYKNVDYMGGFELQGSSILGSSDGANLGKLLIYKDGKIIIRVEARSYLFKEDIVLSNDSRVSIYIEEDSIYHPAANFRYNEATDELLISRTHNGIGRTPFFDSYHRMDITVESIYWKTTEETIEFKALVGQATQTPAIFESQNFFDHHTMGKIQGYNEENPLYTLWKIFRAHGYERVKFQTVVSYFNKDVADIRALLIELAAMGFIEYDINTDEILYRKKIAQYLNNDVGRKDYDNIVLESKTHYAAMSLLNNELRVTGCEFFVLSDSQIVNVYPRGEKVTVKKNRDMNFSGRIVAGLFDFVPHNCEFKYDEFKVEMDIIDSMIMYVEDKNSKQNMYGEYRLREVTSRIEELSGTLYIDVPENKSGLVNYPDYPIFESRKGGKVFYDQKYVQNGAYKRDRFYYLVDVFRLKNLDNFDTDSINFTGELVSGGIFPNIREPLKVRPDFSLGFVHRSNGIDMYGGKANYRNVIDLSNRGLRGNGHINYLTSVSYSDDYIFFLDKTVGEVKSHVVNEQIAGTEFPPASVENAKLQWFPYKDAMYIYTQKTPMSIFNELTLTGNSKLTPNGMFGTGVAKFKRADLTSNLFSFKHHELLADTADLRIFSLESTDEFVFTTDNYNSHIDFKTRKGHFVSNGEASEIIFVKNEFKANASVFDWDPIDDDILRFRWDDDPYKDVDIQNTPVRDLIEMESRGNELVSTNPEKRRLRFTALTAEFNFAKNIINAHGVRFIHVADAAVFPYEGEVTILEHAEIVPLEKARLLAGRYNKYHELHDCHIEVESRDHFIGYGDYDYMNKELGYAQVIHFDTLWTLKRTHGEGKIPLTQNFLFSPHFAFDGRVQLYSEEQLLKFIGGVEIVQNCDTIKHARLRISQQINPDSIFVEVHDRSKDVTDRKVVIAVASSNRTGRIYTAFGTAKDQFNDSEYISVFGHIMYDNEEHLFKAASLDKLLDPEIPGNMITLDPEECIAKGIGAIDMGAKLGRVEFNTNGTITNYMKADSAVMNLTTSINFFFNDNSMKTLYDYIESSSNLEFVDFSDDDSYEMALINMLGQDEYKKYQRDVALRGQVKKLPKNLQVQFLFGNIDFVWDRINKAFTSQYELPVLICGAREVNKMVPGRIVIEKRGSRNRLFIYFEFDESFFFFQFENNNMYGYSSDKKFNNAISDLPAKKRMLQSGNGLPSFTYKLGNKSQKNKFTKKYYYVPEPEDEY